MYAFTRLRNDVDLFRIWYVAIGVTVLYTIMDLVYWEHINWMLLLRGVPETALALLAAGGRGWARVMLGSWLAILATAAGLELALVEQDFMRQLVSFTYASGMTMAAAKAFRLI